MSDDSWPPGPGVREISEWDPADEPGPSGSGSRRPSPKKRKKNDLYGKWLRITEDACWDMRGVAEVRFNVTWQVWTATTAKIREELAADGMTDRKEQDAKMVAAFELFAYQAKLGKVKVRGKSAWSVFMVNRHKYLDARSTPDESWRSKRRWV